MKLLLLSFFTFLSISAFSQYVDRSKTDALAKQEMTHAVHRSLQVATLSDSIDVFYHELNFNSYPGDSSISGNVFTRYTVTTGSISNLYFDMSDSLHVDSIIIHGNMTTYFRNNDNTVRISLPAPISVGITDSCRIYYHGVPKASYQTGTHAGIPEVWTISEPYGASNWWPCKNSLDDKVDSMDIRITTNLGNKAGSLGLLQSIDTVGNKVTYNWKHKYPVTTYLVSLAITNYVEFTEYVHFGNDSFPIVNYVYPEDLSYAKSQVPHIVGMFDLYDSLFMTYPFKNEKYGHAQTRIGGGMEHQTMSTMGFFSDDLMAHELAHQWFGDYVTCASWTELWLNEGFATFLTGLTREHLGTAADWANWKRNKISNVTSQPDGSVFVTDTTQFWRLFNARLTYDKGSMLLHMLRWKMGDDAFYQGVRTYLADPSTKFGYVTNNDLLSHLEAAYNADLDEFFDDWFYGEGYPTYTVTLAGSKPNYSLRLSQVTSHTSVSFFEMPVEVRFQGQGLDTNLRFENTVNNQWFDFTLDIDISVIGLDPNQWLVMGSPSIILGTEEAEINKNQPIIYPQPATDFLKITNVRVGLNPNNFQLIDIAGNQLNAEFKSTSNEFVLNTSNLPAGMYFIVHSDWEKPLKFVK